MITFVSVPPPANPGPRTRKVAAWPRPGVVSDTPAMGGQSWGLLPEDSTFSSSGAHLMRRWPMPRMFH